MLSLGREEEMLAELQFAIFAESLLRIRLRRAASYKVTRSGEQVQIMLKLICFEGSMHCAESAWNGTVR